ncbi:fungal-specific transcription factor domain-containing protein, partial [Dissophora ornata]
ADNKRLRVSKACDSCRRKKKRGPPKGYIEAIEARLHRMEGLLGGLVKDKDPRAEIVRAELDAMAREAEMTGLKLRRSKAYEEINHVSHRRVSLNHQRSDSHAGQSHHQNQALRESDHHRGSSGFSASGNGSSLDMGYRHYNNAGNGYPMDSHRMVTHRPSLTAHHLSNSLTGYMRIPESVNKDEALIMPSIDVIDHLLDVHFRFIHPVLPMLHFRAISDQIHRKESPPSHLLFAVLGLAARFSDNSAFRVPQAGIELPPCAIFYERAKYFIKDEYDNSQIATVQALLLMAVQQMGFCESQRAWLYVGMAIRMAQDLGLNREPSESELTRNRLQCELRKRTWWSLFVVERLVCAGLGRPLTITHKDCEAGFPQLEDDDNDIMDSGTLATRPMVMSNFSHLIALSKIQGNILEFIKAKSNSSANCRVDTSAAAFSLLDKSLTEWRQSLPESLQNPTAQSPQFGLFLHLTFNTLIILLHRPEVPTSQTSASLCTQAAATICDITQILMDAKALTSMFISCLYAIFSAGIIHFMNIPSMHCSHTMSAKTNLKRCIDALKFLASHWVSAARRAKVLEDLLDLKHVSLK